MSGASNHSPAILSRPAQSPRRRHLWRLSLGVMIAAALLIAGYSWWNRRAPQPPTEIFRGVIYGCQRLTENDHGGGLMHWVRVDLSTPELGLYTTPVNADAAARGQEYRLEYANAVAERNHLAVVINGTLFARARWLPLPGTFARSAETVVAAHEINHVDENSYLLWFEDDLTPHLEATKPPPPDAVARARWAIGSGIVSLFHGKISQSTHNDLVIRRTAVGIDAGRRLLWMAVFERATERRGAEELQKLGATDAITLDSGSSTEMAIGPDATGVRPGSLIGSWVPTATHFGVQARPINSTKR